MSATDPPRHGNDAVYSSSGIFNFSMSMSATVFAEVRFWLLVIFSVVLPFGIYGVMLAKRAISRATVLILGLTLVAIAGVDVYLLRSPSVWIKLTPSVAGNPVFVSEISIALYLLPAMFGGIGVNVISHVLVRHLVEAEERFEKKHSDA